MEGVCLLVACALGFAGTCLVTDAALRARSDGTGRRVRYLLSGLPARTLAACEALGHRPLLVRLQGTPRVRGLLDRLTAALRARGVSISRYGATAFALAVTCASCALCVVVSTSALGLPVGVVIAGAGMASLVGSHERGARSEAVAQMPEVLRALSSALASGKSLEQAIAYVGQTVPDPLGSEFLRASFEVESGRSADDAVRALCARVDVAGMELVGTALQVSQRTGGSLSELFARTARMVTSGTALQRELAVKTSQARLSARVVAALPVLLVCALTLISPDYRAGLATTVGRACLCVAVLMDALALAIVRMLMKEALR